MWHGMKIFFNSHEVVNNFKKAINNRNEISKWDQSKDYQPSEVNQQASAPTIS